MQRLRYVEHGDGFVSSQAFDTADGKKALVYLFDSSFKIEDASTREVLASGATTGGSVFLKRTAKNTLLSMLAVNPFAKETRKKRVVVNV